MKRDRRRGNFRSGLSRNLAIVCAERPGDRTPRSSGIAAVTCRTTAARLPNGFARVPNYIAGAARPQTRSTDTITLRVVMMCSVRRLSGVLDSPHPPGDLPKQSDSSLTSRDDSRCGMCLVSEVLYRGKVISGGIQVARPSPCTRLSTTTAPATCRACLS